MKMFILNKILVSIKENMDIINTNHKSLYDFERKIAKFSNKCVEYAKTISPEKKNLTDEETKEIREELIDLINTSIIYGANKKKLYGYKLNIEKTIKYLLKFCSIQSKDLSKRQTKLKNKLDKLIPKELQQQN